LIFDDLKCTSEKVYTSVRDGVKIDGKTNLAEDQGKYDYELLEPEHGFFLTGEITIREAGGSLQSEIDILLGAISYVLSKGKLQVGSLTSFGFGQLQGQITKTELLQGNDYFDFLENGSSYSDDKEDDKEDVKEDDKNLQESHCLAINMKLKPTTPFFIGGGTPKADADDASLQSRGHYIVSAKSMKGALRHHAYRIANTVHDETIANELCNAIFGNRDSKILTKSKFWTTDAQLKNPDVKKEQMQVKIDRFTGGAIDSALFSTEPVWPKDDSSVKVKWKLAVMDEKYKKAAIGLLLLVARDLMRELLPVGGNKAIGRGRFENKECSIEINGQSHSFKIKGNRLTTDNEEQLNSYVTAFLDYKNEASE